MAASFAAGLALVERVSAHLGVTSDLTELATTAAEIAELNTIVERRPDVLTMVRQLETDDDNSKSPLSCWAQRVILGQPP